jgi:nucleoside-diphosphate-sugar epimerase
MLKNDKTQCIAVTGADGFVGSVLCRCLVANGHVVQPIVRDDACATRFKATDLKTNDPLIVGDIGPNTLWSHALSDVDVVIHLAARVHVMDETEVDPLAAFQEVNTEGTRRLAEESARMNVNRLVFVSTIKVNGESTTGCRPLSPEDPACPQDPYGVSKWEAEQALAQIAGDTGLEVVIMRPPLVHGPGVGGNLSRLLSVVTRGIPLPLAAVQNRRSLVGVENLADALMVCACHPAAPGGVFTVSDGEHVSTAELIRRIASGLERPVRLWPCPPFLLVTVARLLGKSDAMDRLVGSLEVDDSRLRQDLGWSPPVSMREGVRAMCRGHKDIK